jgi:hypothetical protein
MTGSGSVMPRGQRPKALVRKSARPPRAVRRLWRSNMEYVI